MCIVHSRNVQHFPVHFLCSLFRIVPRSILGRTIEIRKLKLHYERSVRDEVHPVRKPMAFADDSRFGRLGIPDGSLLRRRRRRRRIDRESDRLHRDDKYGGERHRHHRHHDDDDRLGRLAIVGRLLAHHLVQNRQARGRRRRSTGTRCWYTMAGASEQINVHIIL